MIKFLIASHGRLSSGIKSSLDILFGEVPNLFILEGFLDEESIEKKTENILKEIGDYEQLIVFTDVHGGSVSQQFFLKMKENPEKIKVVAGFNLSLVMECLIYNVPFSDDQLNSIVESSKNTIVFLNMLTDDFTKDDFF